MTSSGYLWGGIALFGYMIICYLIALKKHDFSIVDIAYGLGFLVVAWIGLLSTGTWYLGQLIPVILVSIWGIRLSGHIYIRNKKKGKEDFRYQAMRKRWGPSANLQAFVKIFQFQGIIIYIIALPVLLTTIRIQTPQFPFCSLIGIIIWFFGFYFESVGDAQLKSFLRNPDNSGKIMQSGLWRYTRHPNYFGEATMWWGLFFIALSVDIIYAWITLISPVLITFLLLNVSGVPLLEKHYENNAEFQEYRQKTSKFFPWFPKH
jgi:steroid 5-alpha reductase family enzyme